MKKGYSILRKKLEGVEKDPFVRCFIGIVFLATAAQLFIDINDRREERLIREEERQDRNAQDIARAWAILATPVAGNSGKAQAIETLFRSGVSLRGIDLSCETMNGGWDPVRLTCERPVDLTGMDLRPSTFFDSTAHIQTTLRSRRRSDGKLDQPAFWATGCLGAIANAAIADVENRAWEWTLLRSELHGAFGASEVNERVQELRNAGADFRSAKLSGVDFSGAVLDGVDFSEADVRGALFEDVSGQAALFYNSDLEGARISHSDFSGATFAFDVMNRPLTFPFQQAAESKVYPLWVSESVLDAAHISLPASHPVSVRKSVVRNAFLDASFSEDAPMTEQELSDRVMESLNKSEMLRFGDEEFVPQYSTEFSNSDLTCSVFLEDVRADIGGSNISGALFPPRLTVPNAGANAFALGAVVNHPGWRYVTASPWAWQVNPPFGYLRGEVVRACKEDNAVPRQYNLSVVGAPPACFLARTTFEFDAPPLGDEKGVISVDLDDLGDPFGSSLDQ